MGFQKYSALAVLPFLWNWQLNSKREEQFLQDFGHRLESGIATWWGNTGSLSISGLSVFAGERVSIEDILG